MTTGRFRPTRADLEGYEELPSRLGICAMCELVKRIPKKTRFCKSCFTVKYMAYRRQLNAAAKRMYERRKADGMCTQHGCPNLAVPGKVLCESHAEAICRRKKARYHQSLREGKCPFCGVKTFNGKSCDLCREINNRNSIESANRNIKRRRNIQREAAVRRRARLIADGLCIHCGKRPPDGSVRLCMNCLIKNRERAAKRRNRGA